MNAPGNTPGTAPTPAPANPPTVHTHLLDKVVTDRFLLVVELLSVALTVLGITGKGPQLISWVQGRRGRGTTASQSAPASGGTQTATAEHTIHSAPFQWGPGDEAAMGLAMAAAYGEQSSQAALDRLYGYVANQFTQTQRNLLRGAVCAMEAEERKVFFANLATACADEHKFIHFMKTQGIVQDPSPLFEKMRTAHPTVVADNVRLDQEHRDLWDRIRPNRGPRQRQGFFTGLFRFW